MRYTRFPFRGKQMIRTPGSLIKRRRTVSSFTLRRVATSDGTPHRPLSANSAASRDDADATIEFSAGTPRATRTLRIGFSAGTACAPSDDFWRTTGCPAPFSDLADEGRPADTEDALKRTEAVQALRADVRVDGGVHSPKEVSMNRYG